MYMYIQIAFASFSRETQSSTEDVGSSVVCLLSSSGQICDSATAWLCTFLVWECTHERDAGVYMYMNIYIYIYICRNISLT